MRELILEQMDRYPGMEPQDMVKLLYQSEFGSGHMIKDEKESARRLKEEWKEVRQNAWVPDAGIPAIEPIGGGYCRVSLAVLLEGISLDTLNRLFVLGAGQASGSRERFEEKLKLLSRCCREKEVGFDPEELDTYLAEYREQGCPILSHSETYHRLYHPAYRVLAASCAGYLPVFAGIDQMLVRRSEQTPILVAVEGPCTSGKTTLAQMISQVYDCNVFHMDHFFLRPEQRTAERLAEVGGNVDYERFGAEVLKPVKRGEPAYYRPYDCSRQCLAEEVEAPVKQLNIIEGSYSCHPSFGDCYDLRIFLTIEEEEQIRRIRERNGERMLRRFIGEWIPKENAYFEKYRIRENASIVC